MTTYDQWRLASPPEYDGPPLDVVADFYDVEEEDVTDSMLMDYELDKRERDLTRDL